jgi:nucleoside-diphosphate-sugar epimerase
MLVTGAGGFVGGWVTEGLYLAGAKNIRAGVARWSSAARIARFPVEIVHCDMLKAESLDLALQGVDVVVHCARTVDEERSIAGARLVLERARAAGVRKVVHMSSVAIYGSAEGLVTEDTAPVEPVNPYGRGKLTSEGDCARVASPEMPVAVLRPTLVYGPFSDLWTTPYIRRLASGRWKHLGPAGEGRANLIYVGDLVRFAAFLATQDTGVFSTFNANGPDVPTWNQFLDQFSDALGAARPSPSQTSSSLGVILRRPVRAAGKYVLKNHSELLMRAASRNYALKDLMKQVEVDLRMNPNDDELHLFGLDVTYSMEAARLAGFVPQTSLAEGLRYSVEWARGTGIL